MPPSGNSRRNGSANARRIKQALGPCPTRENLRPPGTLSSPAVDSEPRSGANRAFAFFFLAYVTIIVSGPCVSRFLVSSGTHFVCWCGVVAFGFKLEPQEDRQEGRKEMKDRSRSTTHRHRPIKRQIETCDQPLSPNEDADLRRGKPPLVEAGLGPVIKGRAQASEIWSTAMA